ncbi:hypothetical protein XHC_3747 [Xanthomonas hortorum pv. carotae str. M081]|nr:hypothetical protein XHC_3747 [Xanthomonas hortorum pv. carotae str. M081]
MRRSRICESRFLNRWGLQSRCSIDQRCHPKPHDVFHRSALCICV